MKQLRLWADYYYNCGFNITHIIPKLNINKSKNIFKFPTNDRHILANNRQNITDMHTFDWESSVGIGCVLGFGRLRAIDFDFKKYYYKENEFIINGKDSFIKSMLELLDLPQNYEWVVKTPGGGFHVLFYADNHSFEIAENLTKAFTPNAKSYQKFEFYNPPFHDIFTHMELRWDKHLVLPPSQNEFGEEYQFYFTEIPKNKPFEISIDSLMSMLDKICYDEYSNKSGYNLHLSSYYDNNESDEALKAYSYGEFLDFSPVYLKKGSETNDTNDWDDYNDEFEHYQDNSDDYERDTFDALTDGQYGDYDDWRERGGDMDNLRDRLGF